MDHLSLWNGAFGSFSLFIFTLLYPERIGNLYSRPLYNPFTKIQND